MAPPFGRDWRLGNGSLGTDTADAYRPERFRHDNQNARPRPLQTEKAQAEFTLLVSSR